MPLIQIDKSIQADYEVHTAQIVRAAQYVKDNVQNAIRDALYKSEKEGVPPAKKEKREKVPKNLPVVEIRFWSETEALFYATLLRIKRALENDESAAPVKRHWVMKARKVGLDLFDFYSQAKYIDEYRPKAIIAARKRLSMTISPGSPKLMQILSLSKEIEQ